MVQTDARRDWKNGEDLDRELGGRVTVRRVSSAVSGHLAGDGTKPPGSQLLPNLLLPSLKQYL